MFKMPKGITKGVSISQLRLTGLIERVLAETPEKAVVVMDRQEPRFVVVAVEKWEKMQK